MGVMDSVREAVYSVADHDAGTYAFHLSASCGKQGERVRLLGARITGHASSTGQETREHWTDALLLWRKQPADARDAIVKSVGAKLSTVPEYLGLIDVPRRFVFLPKTACALGNAVA